MTTATPRGTMRYVLSSTTVSVFETFLLHLTCSGTLVIAW